MAIEWDLYKKLRRMYLVDGLSQRNIARQLGISRRTIQKYCTGKALPDIRKMTERPAPLRDAVEPSLLRLLEQNKALPRKQQWNAHQIWKHLLSTEGIGIAESTVRQYIRELRNHHLEEFIPLAHDPGEAIQMDWGDAAVCMDGRRRSISMFCAALPHSGAIFAFVYPDKTMLSFMEGHIQAFEILGGVPRYCVYDNLKTAVFSGSGKHAVKNRQFARMEAHYVFQAVFCNVESGWEKGSVENAVDIVRKFAFVPMPHVANFAELQTHVTAKCLQYIQEHKIRNHPATLLQEFEADRAALLPLPGMPLDNGFTTPALVHPDQTVRHDNIRYSVPHGLVGCQVTLRLSPFHLSIFHNGLEVHRHQRATGKEDHQYVLEHYLETLSRKPRAVEQAIPIRKGIMPKECSDFLNLCPEKNARQQLVDILLLGRGYERDTLLWAIQQANSTRRPTFTLVKAHLEMTRAPASLDGPVIHKPDLLPYDALLEKGERRDGNDTHTE